MKASLKHLLGDVLLMAAGILSAGIGLKGFLMPNHFLDGGATGISILLHALYDIDLSLLLLIINAPFLALSYFVLSKSLFIRSVVTVIALAVVVHFVHMGAWTDDQLLTAIFGGIFLGMGIGLTIRGGAVLDGSEVLALYLNNRYGLTVGKVIMTFNLILFISTAYLQGLEIAMYSILTFIVTAKVTDNVVQGFEEYVGITIVSAHSETIRHSIMQQMGVGVTVYKGETGGYQGMKELKVLQTVVNRFDLNKLYHLLEHIDEKAFIVEYEVNHVKGGVVRRLLPRKIEH